MSNVLNLVLSVVSVIGAFGGLIWLEKELKIIKTTAKSKNLKLALDFAIGAVTFAERFATSGETQQLQAVNNLKNRLKENGLEANFTDTQLKQIIQQAYAQSKANGLIDAVKKEA